MQIKRNKKLERKIIKIVNDEQPDIIDVQGAEISLGDVLVKCNIRRPVNVTLQGSAKACLDAYTKGIPLKQLVCGRTKNDNIHLKGILERKLFMQIRAMKEQKILRGVNYCIGRTHFDKTEAERINPHIKYFSCNRILRSDFYSYQWDIKKTEKHKIFGIQSGVPYKGLHYAIKVIAKLKEKYPDVILEIPGGFKLDEPESKIASYPKYINKLIDEYGVRENIIFLPSLNPEEMAGHLMTSRLFYQCSLIENSPNSLAEAQIMGVPVVASNVGGTSSYVENGVSGILFDSENIDECVEKISRVFEDDELCLKLSSNGKSIARERHNVEKNTEKLVSIYKDIISDSI